MEWYHQRYEHIQESYLVGISSYLSPILFYHHTSQEKLENGNISSFKDGDELNISSFEDDGDELNNQDSVLVDEVSTRQVSSCLF